MELGASHPWERKEAKVQSQMWYEPQAWCSSAVLLPEVAGPCLCCTHLPFHRMT